MTQRELQKLIKFIEKTYRPLLKQLGGKFTCNLDMVQEYDDNLIRGYLCVCISNPKDIFFFVSSGKLIGIEMWQDDEIYRDLLYIDISNPLIKPFKKYIMNNFCPMAYELI